MALPTKDISESVKRLILASIDSVPELETLLLLRDKAEQSWTAAETGQRIYVSEAVAAHILSELVERGFLAATGSNYRYAPATDELRNTVEDLADAYAHHLVEVTRMIHSKPSASVRQFANAFVLKKDK